MTSTGCSSRETKINIRIKTSVSFVVVACLLSSANNCSAFAQQPPARVVVISVIVQEIAAGNTFVATVLPLKRAVIGSAIDGRITELFASEGDRVEAMRPLAQVLTSTIELELDAAEAELEFRRQALAELENGSLPDEIVQANAKMLGAQSNLEYTQTRFRRLQTLRESNAASDQDLDEAAAAAELAVQNYADLKAAYTLMVAGPRPEKIAQAKAQVAMQQALVDHIKNRIEKYTIRTRFSGYVVAKHTEEGAWVKTGDPVMEVVELDELELEAYVTEQNVPFVKQGMSVRVEIPALPSRSFTGTVAAVIPQADTRSRTFPVKILMQNTIGDEGPLVKAGMFARVELPTGSMQTALMVPKDALVLGGPQPVVFVVSESTDEAGQTVTTATPIPVELGVSTNNLIQVKGGLQAGAQVVIEGNERLRPGQPVTIISK